jgi:hypothetical protein
MNIEAKRTKAKKAVSDGVVIGKKILSIAETVLVALVEECRDVEYMRTHALSLVGRDVREARLEAEEGMRMHELRMQRQAIDRLREREYVRLRKEGNRVVCELTDDGMVKALKTAIKASAAYFFDDRICLVSFDIPEASKNARIAFRRFLKSAGFKFVQGSVWSIKKDVIYELNILISRLKINKWVEVYTAQQ